MIKFSFNFFLLLVCFFSSIQSLHAQTAPHKQWDKTIGGSLYDDLNVVQQTTDGGYILCGHSNSGISGDKSLNTKGRLDCWLVKLNKNGIKVWERSIGGTGDESEPQLIQTADRGYILGVTSDSGLNGDKSYASKGGKDYWIIKLDSIGNKIWDKGYGGNKDDILNSIQATSDGGYILGGASESGISGDKSEINKGLFDCWLIKIDANGNKQWEKSFGGNKDDGLKTVKQTLDGGYLVGGGSESDMGQDKSQPCKGGPNNQDFWILKLNASGNKIWDKSFGGYSHDYCWALKQTPDGGYFLAGSSASDMNGDKSDPNRGGLGSLSYDFWVLKLDSNGNKSWDKTFGGDGFDLLSAMASTMDGGFILGGQSTSGVSGDKSQPCTNNDFWVIKITSTGTKEWDLTLGGNDLDYVKSIAETSDGGYIIGGNSESGINGDKTEAHRGFRDYWIVKLSAPCSALTANLSAVCHNGDTDLNVKVTGFFHGPGNKPTWTLTYAINGIDQTLTDTTAFFNLLQNAPIGTTVMLKSIVSGTCSTTLTQKITIQTVPDAPVLAILKNKCGGKPAMLSATGAPEGGSYVWYEVATGGVPVYSSETGDFETPPLTSDKTYFVAARNNAGCEGPRTAITVNYESCPPIYIPNIITLNNDSKNDKFVPLNLSEDKWNLQIYNRWGVIIYEEKNYQGTWPNQDVKDGVYYYLFSKQGTYQKYKGWVEVVH